MAGDVNFVVDFEVDKAKRGLKSLQDTVDSTGKKTKSLGMAFQVMLGNLGAQAASVATRMIKDFTVSSVKGGIKLEKSSALLARRTGVSKDAAQQAIEQRAKEFGVSVEDAGAVLLDAASKNKITLDEARQNTRSAFVTAKALGEDVAPVSEAIAVFSRKFGVDTEKSAAAIFELADTAAIPIDRMDTFIENIRGQKTTAEQLMNILAAAKGKVGAEQLKTVLGPLLGEGPETKSLKRLKQQLMAEGEGLRERTTFADVELASIEMRKLGGEIIGESIETIKNTGKEVAAGQVKSFAESWNKMVSDANKNAVTIEDANGVRRTVRSFRKIEPGVGETIVGRGWIGQAQEEQLAIDAETRRRSSIPSDASLSPGRNIYGASPDDPYGRKAKAAADEANRIRREQLSEQKALRMASEK